MDSSQSQSSDHPVSRSDNGSGDRSSSGSDSDSESKPMSTSDLGSNSARSTSSTHSVGNNPPENPDSESSGSLKTITSTDFEPDEEDDSIDTMNIQSTPRDQEQHETASNVQENVKETATATATASSSHGGEQRRGAEEIGFLTDLYAFYNRTQHYSSVRNVDVMEEFYNRQVNVYRAYATEDDVDQKLTELYENYMKVVENKVEAPTDPIDIEIFRQSSWVWGDDDEDSSKQETGDDDMIEKSKDPSNQETGDDDMIKDPKDSSKQETGDDDMKEPAKDSSKQETGDDNMKESGDFLKDSGGITGHGRKDSSEKNGGPSGS